MDRTYFGTAASAVALACASAAQAGDAPVYDRPPNWIETVSVEEVDEAKANDLIVSDRQVRIEQGLHWEYHDKVYRISDPSDLRKFGTLKFQWFPDKGDLILHEVSIVRDGEVIDLLADSSALEVLRRERQLERGILDGILTATLAVPGLAIGDQLRTRYSVTTSDQALGIDVQSQLQLLRERSTSPSAAVARRGLLSSNPEADFARILVSWPKNLEVRYQAVPDLEINGPEARDGYRWLDIAIPLPAANRLPLDAPLRYRMPALLQVGTFSDWADVSATMAPLYQVEGSFEGLPGLAAEVDAIAAQPISDLEKAVDALELVQEDIRYLLNGLDGGNYIPQNVATTWEMKYGDCKAKTVMLLALLDRLGIEAEAVMVSTNRGNAVPTSLPIPGAFNHVLVRAIIDGQEYFLDGTSVGANIKTVGNVPHFEFYLPIRNDGASLQPIEQTLPRIPETELDIVADGSAGADLPTLGTVRVVVTGAMAAQMSAEKDKLEDLFMSGAAPHVGQTGQIVDVNFLQGDDDSELTIEITAIMPPFFKFEGTRGEFTPGSIPKAARFAPNRAQRLWRDIPVRLGNPGSIRNTIRVLLPFDTAELEVNGTLNFEGEAAGKTFVRQVVLDGDQFIITEQITSRGGELAPEDVFEERRKSQRVEDEKLVFVAPGDVERMWRFAGNADRSALQPLEDAYAQAIHNRPGKTSLLVSRARFRSQTFDFEGALSDYTTALEIEASADLYGQRAEMHAQQGDWASARLDLQEAYALEPTPTRAIALARAMINLGETGKARDLLELEGGDGDAKNLVVLAVAELDAIEGDKATGLRRIADELEDDPNDPKLLNGRCWFIGTWTFRLDEGEDACRLAVERSENTAQALDSRAMYWLRRGELEKARDDIEEALSLAPGQAASLLLRGLIKQEQGDSTANSDLNEAIARRPQLAVSYARWGFDLETP